MVTRRQLLRALAAGIPAATGVFGRGTVDAAASIKYGYAGITWGNDYLKAIDEIAAAGFRGIQLRSSDGLLDRFGTKPAELRDLLAQKRLAFPVFSSGNLSIDPAREREMIDLHTGHARFVKAAGGLTLQIIDERPKGRAVVAADYARAGRLLTELGRRVRDEGVTMVYHPHMNSTGEKPQELDAILQTADRRNVRLLFDTAHFQQGGGDPVAAIRKYRDWIDVLHLKDVRNAPSTAGAADGYQFVELGRGRVDLPGVFESLSAINFQGWGVVELDRVPEPGRTPRESADINRQYLEKTLHQTL
jgi:inosose dehydratase